MIRCCNSSNNNNNAININHNRIKVILFAKRDQEVKVIAGIQQIIIATLKSINRVVVLLRIKIIVIIIMNGLTMTMILNIR